MWDLDQEFMSEEPQKQVNARVDPEDLNGLYANPTPVSQTEEPKDKIGFSQA